MAAGGGVKIDRQVDVESTRADEKTSSGAARVPRGHDDC